MSSLGRGTLLLALLVGTACGSKEPVDPLMAAYRSAQATADEAVSLRESGDLQASQETFLRALANTQKLLAQAPAEDPKGLARPDLFCQLAYLCNEIGPGSPGHYTLAIRYARRGIEATGGNWPKPWLDLGISYDRTGFHDRAVSAFERALGMMPEKERRQKEGLLVTALYNEASAESRSGELGAEGKVHALLKRAWELRPDAAANPEVFRARAGLQKSFEQEAERAQKGNDDLELAQIFARYGLTDDAVKYLVSARNRLGRTEAVRWTEARYVDEMSGEPEKLQRAADIYEEMLARGERVPQTSAGWVRVHVALKRLEDAEKRFGSVPNPSAELRTALLGLEIARTRALPEEPKEAVKKQFDRIRELLKGAIDPTSRSRLTVEAAVLASQRGFPDLLKGWIRDIQRQFPRDFRVFGLDALYQDLTGAKLPGMEASE